MSTSNKNVPSILQSTVMGGTAAVFAVNFTHPIELVKSRVQVNNMGVIQTISDTAKNEGIVAFWKGLPWAYCREGSYTAIRLGAYAPVRDAIGAGAPDSPVYMKFLAGAMTGAIGSIAGNPFDVLKVRNTEEGLLMESCFNFFTNLNAPLPIIFMYTTMV
ncbi:unnamed protein product [Pseudo-nitzschia multistriata]|uniref:Mitochondrial carrier protein n=1 Tax=Pseudo-nitzschia multistriata TaxID=183589 RepID=A0A448Z8M5_9STRA|nr:unnamed protein product [Pseudo-nitzschia multistriata]